jgi:hypothetical protein
MRPVNAYTGWRGAWVYDDGPATDRWGPVHDARGDILDWAAEEIQLRTLAPGEPVWLTGPR